jgi:hypothetical protein
VIHGSAQTFPSFLLSEGLLTDATTFRPPSGASTPVRTLQCVSLCALLSRSLTVSFLQLCKTSSKTSRLPRFRSSSSVSANVSSPVSSEANSTNHFLPSAATGTGCGFIGGTCLTPQSVLEPSAQGPSSAIDIWAVGTLVRAFSLGSFLSTVN